MVAWLKKCFSAEKSKEVENSAVSPVALMGRTVSSLIVVAATDAVQNTCALLSNISLSLPGLPNNSAASVPGEKTGAWPELMQRKQEACVKRVPAINVESIPTRQVSVTR